MPTASEVVAVVAAVSEATSKHQSVIEKARQNIASADVERSSVLEAKAEVITYLREYAGDDAFLLAKKAELVAYLAEGEAAKVSGAAMRDVKV